MVFLGTEVPVWFIPVQGNAGMAYRLIPFHFEHWFIIIIIIFLAHQHKAAGMKIKLSKNNDHDGILLGVKSA